MVHILLLMSSLIASVFPCVEAGSKGSKLYGRIVICVLSCPLGVFLSFPEGFSLYIHILSTWHIRWPLSPLYHCAVLALPILYQIRGLVLIVAPPLCVPLSILTQSLQGIPLMNRRQLTLSRCVIMLYFLVAPSCTYLSPVLFLVIDEGIHHLKMHIKEPRSILLVSLMIYLVD